MTGGLRAVAVSGLAALVLACAARAPSSYALAFAQAERAQNAGRYAEAADGFLAAAADETQSQRDRDHATLLAAHMRDRAGDRAGARALLEPLTKSPTTYGIEAQYELGVLFLASEDPALVASGWAALDAYARAHPEVGTAIVAMRRRVRHEDETGPAAALAYLDGLAPAIKGTALEEFVLYERAERLARLGRDTDALAAFLELAARFPYPGPHFDDALFRASELDEKLGRFDDAIRELRRMLVERERSDKPGTYERPRFHEGAYRIAVLLRDRVGDKKAARQAFLDFANDFENAQTRDDALWQASRLAETDGERCRDLEKLIAVRPDSRYVPCALARCSGLTRPKDSVAPPTCHAYLLRD